ncbi:uncharacterized protein LOC129750650 isoform X1 [Uranotaenia lowii]|uniref:uncharacterized protein LOC129750650 isoform X1 n=2 Tax=Uranotaenia lowii TaxID=190385 RepID=UPI00247A0A14|nr:uncharacterized protein LOC129750650 isoform X1 [Uranotaenia lowii]
MTPGHTQRSMKPLPPALAGGVALKQEEGMLKADIMKFHNYSSPPSKTRTTSASSETEPALLVQEQKQRSEAPPNAKASRPQQQQRPPNSRRPQINLKEKITPEQLLQLQQQQQLQPVLKRPRLDSSSGGGGGTRAVDDGDPTLGEEEDEEDQNPDEEPELDTSATESETEIMEQGVQEDMIVSHPAQQRIVMNALKAKAAAGATTIIMTDDTEYQLQTDDGLDHKKVKRKPMANRQPSSSNSTSNNATSTSTKVKLQMVHEFPTLFLGLRRNRIFLVNSLAQSFDLNQRDIILTLRKIKLNEHNARLASVFGLNDSEVEVLFRTSVPRIADCLRNFIVWPDDVTMKLNVPINLRQHFNKIHLIVNYLVIKVRQNAIKYLSQAQAESSYCEIDQCHKLKYLVASTLDGCVCFVSRGFGIATDDEAVLAQSGFLTKFKTNTNLIAGKNFHNFEDRLTNGSEHDHENNNGGGGGGRGRMGNPNLDQSQNSGNEDENFEEIVSEKISKSRTFKLKSYIESVLESFQSHLILAPTACVDGKCLELLDDVVVIVGALINLQKQEVE